jgi:hypothetical protein
VPGGIAAERRPIVATSCFTDQAPATLPNEQDLREAQEALSAVCGSLVTLQWRMQRIARAARIDDYPEYALGDGDEIPTFAHIGELYSFALNARSRLEEAEDYLNGFEKHIPDLDTVRMMHLGNDA